jgi:DNA-binding GntR family transcriptional regulator
MKNAPIRDEFARHNRASNIGHKEIMTAILAKDADKAVNALSAHLTRNYGTSFHRTLAIKMAEIS